MTASLYQRFSSCGANDCSPYVPLLPPQLTNVESANADGSTTSRFAQTSDAASEPRPLILSNVLEKYAPEAPTDSNPQNSSTRAKRSAHLSTNHEPGMTLPNPAPVHSRQH